MRRSTAGPRLPESPEILVVGGGPAGSTVAGLLARAGREVSVVDRALFPRPKACGECLNPGAVTALERLGLLETVLALEPARLDGWSVSGARSRATAAFGQGLQGLGVARDRLDAALLEQARRGGARVVERARVEMVEPAEGTARPRVHVRLDDGRVRTLRPRAVVGADGLRSRVARSLGLVKAGTPPPATSLTCRVAWSGGLRAQRGSLRVHDGITLGVAPVEAGGERGNATVVLDPRTHRAALAGDPRTLVMEILRARLAQPPEIVAGPWASGPFRRSVPRPWAPGVVLVGDAAGYYDPFTGQGIYRALRSAELAADALQRSLSQGRGAGAWPELARYGRRWRAEVGPGRRVQRVVDAVMRTPWLREPALAAVGWAGLLPSIIRVTGDAAPVSSLLHPLAWAAARE